MWRGAEVGGGEGWRMYGVLSPIYTALTATAAAPCVSHFTFFTSPHSRPSCQESYLNCFGGDNFACSLLRSFIHCLSCGRHQKGRRIQSKGFTEGRHLDSFLFLQIILFSHNSDYPFSFPLLIFVSFLNRLPGTRIHHLIA